MFRSAVFTILSSIFLFTLFNSNNLIAQQPDKVRVAVLDFEGKGISQNEAKTLTERFSSTLVGTQKFIIIERQKINLILEEIGLQMTGTISEESLVEAGKLLGVQKIITGSIGKIEDTYTVDLRVVDVQTSKISGTISQNTSGTKENLISLLERVAKRMAGIKVETMNYTLKVFSVPGNSSVYVDGRYAGLTPFEKEFQEGIHHLKISHEGYDEWEGKVEIYKDEKVTAKLEKKTSAFTKWLWIGGGTLVAGGGILAAILLAGDEKSEEKEQPIGTPPNPPGN